MNRKRRFGGRFLAVISGVLVVLVGSGWALHQAFQQPSPDLPAPGIYSESRSIYWNLTVRNKGNTSLRDVPVSTFSPLPVTWNQKLQQLDSNYPLEADYTNETRSVATVTIDQIPPFGQREIRLEAILSMASDYNNMESRDPDQWLAPEPLIESDHPEIRSLAARLDRGTTKSTTKAIYSWLVAEMEYGGFDPVDQGALYAVRKRRGDCSEYAALAVALSRALDIPARKVSGFVITENGRLDPFAYHAWAELWVDDRWLVLDGQGERFDPAPPDYMAVGYGAGQSEKLPWTRFHSPIDAVSISMR